MKTFLYILLLIPTPIFAQNEEQSIISANNQFAADVYNEISEKEESNFVFSPFSIESVFAFAQSGARGETAQELRTGLHLPDNQTQIEQEFKDILPQLKDEEGVYIFHLANKLYLDKSFEVKDDFKRTAVDTFDADLENVEFSENIQAAKTINSWVEDKTEKKIHDLIGPEGLDPHTVAVLVNTLYFQGNWSTSFSGDGTVKRDFYHINRKIAPVDTMHVYMDQRTFNYAENQELDAKFLELPFQGGDVSMVLVLPNDKDGIGNLEKQIDKVFSFHSFQRERVNISMPKFKIETEIDVKSVLQSLGVRKAFSPEEADFSGISDKQLRIDQAIQQTFISTYENGVEAAGATYASSVPYSALEKAPTPRQFHADQPFVFYFTVKYLIVFAGRVGAPIL